MKLNEAFLEREILPWPVNRKTREQAYEKTKNDHVDKETYQKQN